MLPDGEAQKVRARVEAIGLRVRPVLMM